MSKKILIVEDSKMMLETMKKFFEDNEYNVIGAEDGEKGLEMTASEKPDIVLIDTVLPGIDGFETCAKMREIEGLGSKLIVMTSEMDAIDVGRAKESGADDYAVKTSDLSALHEAVKNVLKG